MDRAPGAGGARQHPLAEALQGAARGAGGNHGGILGLAAAAWLLLAPPPALAGAAGAGEAAAAAPRAPFTDYRFEAPGSRRRISAGDLPEPYATHPSANPAPIVARPQGAWPKAPAGFRVERYASGLDGPRVLRLAPNADLFVAESRAGRISVLRASKDKGHAPEVTRFAEGLELPYGIAFYPPGPEPRYVFVGTPGAVLRFDYRKGDRVARGPAQRIAVLPSGGGHWTRDLQFSPDGRTLYVAVGSASNVAEPGSGSDEDGRADILAFDPDGSHRRVLASGLRNPSGLAIEPRSGALWCVVNERDGLGDDLVPDYVTRVQPGGFYGWPWWYIGRHPDPRHAAAMPQHSGPILVPDVLLQPHSAPLQLVFYSGSQFPPAYRGNLFASSHGSWNRSVRAGYEVVRMEVDGAGGIDGSYEDFLTGFVLPDGSVWGRPVGLAVAGDGSLLVSDDASGSIWRVSYAGP